MRQQRVISWLICWVAVVGLFCAVPYAFAQNSELTRLIDFRGKNRDAYASFVRLLHDPGKYDGKYIILIGCLKIGPQNNALYLSSEDARYGNTKHAILLEIPPQLLADLRRANSNNTFYLLSGVFSCRLKVEEERYWSGKLKNIEALTLLPES